MQGVRTIKPLRRPRYIRDAEVQRENEDEEGQVQPRRGRDVGEEDFEEGEGGVHGVLGDVGPRRVGGREC